MTDSVPAARTRRLRSIFNFQPGEGRRVAIMILYSAASIGGVLTVGMAAADALFIAQLPASDLPFLFILPAVAIAPAVFLYNRLAPRLPAQRAIIASNILLLCLIALFRILLTTAIGKSFPVLAALELTIEVSYTLVILQFWTVAGRIFNVREAKRLYGVIAAGGTVANILAGLVIGSLSSSIGAENLLFIVIAALLVCGLCARSVIRLTPLAPVDPAALPRPKPEPPRSSFQQDIRSLWRSPLLRAIGGLTILLSLLINIGMYQFCLALQANFAGRSTDLAAYLGALEFLAGLAAIVVQTYLSARIMRRWGVFAALLIFPLGMLFSAALSLIAAGALWAISLIRTMDPILRRTINTSALNVLYLPTPIDLRQRATELFEALYAVTFGAAGVIFLILQAVPSLSTVAYSMPLLSLAILWLWLIYRTRPLYKAALAQSLRRRVLDLANERIDLTDETTVQVLFDSLKNPDPIYVLHALSLMESASNVDWNAHVAPLLDHPSVDVRIAALQHLARAGNVEYAEAIGRLLNSTDETVCAAAIEATCAVSGSRSIDHIVAYLASTHLSLQSAAIIGLIKYGEAVGQTAAQAALDRWQRSDDVIQRCEAARVIGLLPPAGRSSALIDLWNDPQRQVRLAVINAAAKLRAPELLAHLIETLADPYLAGAALAALVNYGPAGEPELSRLLSDEKIDTTLRAKIPAVLRRIGTPAAIHLLIDRLIEPQTAIRAAVVMALDQLRSDDTGLHLPDDKLRAAIMREVHDYYALAVLLEDLKVRESDSLLTDTLQSRLTHTLDLIFLLIKLLYPNQKVDRARDALRSAQSPARASAIELLDNLLDHRTKEVLLPLIEGAPAQLIDLAQQRLNITRQSRLARLTALAQSEDNWLRACALFEIGRTQSRDLIEPVRAALHSNDDLLRETALVAVRTLIDRDQYRAALNDQAADDRFPFAQRYAREQLLT